MKDSGKQFLIPSTLIIHGFPICKFAYSLKFICNPKISICNVSAVICRHSQEVKYLSSPTSTFPTEVKQGDTLSSCFSSHKVKKSAFLRSILCHDFCIFIFLCVWFHWPRGPPKLAGLLSSIAKHKKAVMWLSEKIQLLNKLHSGMLLALTSMLIKNIY